jgi:hypothetical protein
MYQGYIKLHRKILDWEWYSNSKMVHLFLHLLISASHKSTVFRGIHLKRGQLVTGRFLLTKQTCISEQTIRTYLKWLKSTNEITIKSTNKFSIITICNYDRYNLETTEANQQINQQANQQLTSNQPATNQQLTTIKNVKNAKNVKNVKKRALESENFSFSSALNLYPGSKRSYETEFANFKKHADWNDVLQLLCPAIENQIKWRTEANQQKKFVPEWRRFSSWISERYWELKIETDKENRWDFLEKK